MSMMKAILTIALTLAITIALTSHTITKPVQVKETRVETATPKIRVSRFLAEGKNPRAADHCHKDGEVCAATNTTCCNNKCIDLHNDRNNCGTCNHKCKYTEVCCRGQSVNLAFDKRHCGSCNNKCMTGGFCVYGLCNYA